MTDNLQLWEAVEKTDPKHTKEFKRGGGFKGTATNPTYLARKATEQFGPCGIGWGVDIVKETYAQGGPLDPQGTLAVVHVVQIAFWYMRDEKRGEITAFGQTDFVSKNKYGIVTDEEAPKKSLTDAMTKAMSLLGFSADIHMGMYDDSKYVAEVRREFAPEPKAQPKADDKPDPKAAARTILANVEKITDAAACNVSAVSKANDTLWASLSEKQVEYVSNQIKQRAGTLSQAPIDLDDTVPF